MSKEQGFQSMASKQGREFEDAVALVLKCKGWTIDGLRQKIGGEEVDIVATDDSGQQWWIECKGSWQAKGGVNGLRRGDTVKKACGVAWHLSMLPDEHRRPYMIVTSHRPIPGTGAARMLDDAVANGLFHRVDTLAFESDLTFEYEDEEDDAA